MLEVVLLDAIDLQMKLISDECWLRLSALGIDVLIDDLRCLDNLVLEHWDESLLLRRGSSLDSGLVVG